jgi:hypothetical protein
MEIFSFLSTPFFQFLWCSQTGAHQQKEDLAKFGYRPDMKVKML